MKKWMLLATVLVMTMACACALAAPEITVSGTGTVQVPADLATVSLGVSARDQDVLLAQAKVNGTIAAIREALTGAGFAAGDINTDYINIYALYDYQEDGEQLSAYNANSNLSIRVTDMDRVGEVIDLAFQAGANTLNGISFSAGDTAEAKTKALEAAVRDARQKAETLANCNMMKIICAQKVVEGGVYSMDAGSGVFGAMGVTEEKAEDAAPTVVQAAKISVTATVTITYETQEYRMNGF